MTPRHLLPAVCLLLASCAFQPRGGGYYQDDGPHSSPPADADRVPDAIPRPEVRSTSGNKPYVVFGRTYTPVAEARGYRERGVASWYGKKFHGNRTSNGETYDMYAMTAAHKTLPLPSYVRVTNLANGSSVVVRVNDRGPFLHDRLIDLSYAAAARLGIVGTGTGLVEIEGLDPGAPVATPAPPPVAGPGPGAPRLYVQVGAFSNPVNAEQLKASLERADFRPVRVETSQQQQGPVYRVRIGPLANIEDGDRLTARVASHGISDARIVVE